MARAQPMLRALYGPIGSSGIKNWVHGRCCHGERGPKLLKGRAAAAHVGCCVLWLCFVLWLAIEYCFYLFCRVEHPTNADILSLF